MVFAMEKLTWYFIEMEKKLIANEVRAELQTQICINMQDSRARYDYKNQPK